MNENKRIGMAINYDYPDYGGMLQAYASFRKIKDLGYEPEAINIDAISKDIRNRKLKYFAKNILDASIVAEKSQIVFKKIKGKLDKNLNANLSKRKNAFEQFHKEHFRVSKEYKSWEELRTGCLEYSSVVVGSDQLWLPSNIAGDYYTLSFVPDEVNKVAYATSFGVADIGKGQEEIASTFLSRIQYLSAREEAGRDIIRKYTGRNVPLVCDPAMLLTAQEWDEDATPGRLIKEPYIFCYFMGNNPWQREFVKKLRLRTGYKVVGLLHLDQYIKMDEDYVDAAPYDISPADFINLVKNAEMVCTDSFHGTVFSLIYGKKFFTFMRFSEKATLSTNSRIYTLLKRVGVENRLVREDTDVDMILKQDLDNQVIQDGLNAFRQESLRYLAEALEKK
mgnify:CR=1 FL=1